MSKERKQLMFLVIEILFVFSSLMGAYLYTHKGYEGLLVFIVLGSITNISKILN
jgi:hypothetical protein